MKRLLALVLVTMPAAAQLAWAEPDPWKERSARGMTECKRLYTGAQLKVCSGQVREIIQVSRHPPRAMPARLVQPNTLYGLP